MAPATIDVTPKDAPPMPLGRPASHDPLAPASAAPLDAAALERLLEAFGHARAEIAKAVVGHQAVLDQLLIAPICEGHVLLQGAPGVGKTLLVRTLANVAGLTFARVQFTPDLMPADITGGLALIPDEGGRTRSQYQ